MNTNQNYEFNAQDIRVIRKNNISIAIKIDYLNKTVTLLDQIGTNPSFWKAKNFKFAERGLKDLVMWDNVLDAMKYAINEGRIALEDHEKHKDNNTQT